MVLKLTTLGKRMHNDMLYHERIERLLITAQNYAYAILENPKTY